MRLPSLPYATALSLLIFAAATAQADGSAPIRLPEALAAARGQALETLRLQAELEQARAEVASVDAVHDTILFGQLLWEQDRSESSLIFAGDRRDKLMGELGLRKVLPAATMLEAKAMQSRNYTDFPPPVPGLFDASAVQSMNPARETKLELLLVQPLWRNWLGREFDQQRALLQSGVAPAELNLKLQAQMVQAETEQYYWNLAEIEAQLALTDKLIAQSRKFANLMRERTAYGRADDVDVAAADAAVVQQEGRYLDLIFLAEHYRRRIRMAMNPAGGFPADVTGATPVALPANILADGALGKAAPTAKESLDLALKRRVDLQLLDLQQQPLKAQLALTREQNKPEVNAFAGVGTNGMDGRWDQATVDAFDDGKHVSYRVGVQAEVNLQRSEVGARDKIAAAQMAALDAQKQLVAAKAQQEIEFAFSGFESAHRKRAQAQRAIESLKTKRDAEYKKFLQARSEEIVVLSYDLEVLAAQAELIAADKLARDSEVRLRTAVHGYPDGR